MDARIVWQQVADEARLVVSEAVAAGLSIGTAESCTGGLVCGALTDVPGSSQVVRGGVVSYDPAVKHEVLGVERAIIDDPAVGVVSEECALQMSDGARRVLGCDIAVSVTGIAGPGGAEPGKPVGTVWFAIGSSVATRAVLHHFAGSREEVRLQAVLTAERLLREAIMEIAVRPEAPGAATC